MLLPGLYNQLLQSASVTSKLASPALTSIFINNAPKQAPRPHLVLNVVTGLPAGQTLDGISAMIDGEIQFDAYGDKPQDSRLLSLAARDYLMNYFNEGTLSDGTTIQFVEVTMDHDEPYEQGGAGYLYRTLLRLRAFYTPTQLSAVPHGADLTVETGEILGSGNQLSLSGAQVNALDYGSSGLITGDLGTVFLVTPTSLASGNLSAGGTFAAGGSIQITTPGYPLSYIGTLGSLAWTLITEAGGTHYYELTGTFSSQYGSGAFTLTTKNIGANLWNGSAGILDIEMTYT